MSLLNNDFFLYVLVNVTFFFLTTHHRIIPERVVCIKLHTYVFTFGDIMYISSTHFISIVIYYGFSLLHIFSLVLQP